MNTNLVVRQGDVLLTPVNSIPPGAVEVDLDKGRIVLAYGEVTGHAHAIADYIDESSVEIKDALIARVKARLLKALNGDRFLEVKSPVTLKHEEHSAITIAPGIYKLPTQVQYTPKELIRVAD